MRIRSTVFIATTRPAIIRALEAFIPIMRSSWPHGCDQLPHQEAEHGRKRKLARARDLVPDGPEQRLYRHETVSILLTKTP